jgi:hypothetical protein
MWMGLEQLRSKSLFNQNHVSQELCTVHCACWKTLTCRATGFGNGVNDNTCSGVTDGLQVMHIGNKHSTASSGQGEGTGTAVSLNSS